MRLAGILVVLALCVALSVGYSTSGLHILDPNGNPILLRGVARPSLEWTSAGQYLSLSDYQLMKNWGANVVRLSLNQCFYLSGLVDYNSSYISTINQQVTWIKSLGMGVILDLHWSNQGNSGTECAQQEMPDSYSTQFWTSLATAHANDAWVIFELYNEPYGVSWSIWRNGGTGSFSTPGFQALYNTVRATGANNLVLIGGLDYAYDLSGVPEYAITGTNIAYNTHPYSNTGKMPANWPTNITVAANLYPVVATEFGVTDCSTSYVESWIEYADSLNIGWTSWGWFVSGCSFPSIINDWSGDTLGYGSLVKTELTSGLKVPSSSSTATSTTTAKAATTTTTTAKAGTTTTTTAKASTTTTSAKISTTTTTGGSANTIPVYTDSVLNPFADWSWASVRNAEDPTQKFSGSYSYSFQPSDYGAIYFYYAGGINPAIHKCITFYINIGSGGQSINFNMIQYTGGNSNKIGQDEPVSYYGTLTDNAWVEITVPLDDFPSEAYDGFWIIGQTSGTQNTVYVDQVTVVGL